MKCPFCAFETQAGVLVCSACSHDIVAPPSLIEERDDLLRKLEGARDEHVMQSRSIRRSGQPTSAIALSNAGF